MGVENFLQRVLRLETEEKILNGAALIGFFSVLFPWVGGEWLGRPVTYSGLGFFTSFIGFLILALDALTVLITAVPLYGGPKLVRQEHTQIVRLIIASQAVVLTIAAWSVLTEFTLEFSRLEIHFGLYATLVANLVVTLYAFLGFQEIRRQAVQKIFHNATENAIDEVIELDYVPAPQTDQPEDYRIRL